MSGCRWPMRVFACYTRASSPPAVAAGPVSADRHFCVMERALKHKFPIGAAVYFTASNVSRPATTGTYEVIRQLPTEGDDCQYRIKNSTEAVERAARGTCFVSRAVKRPRSKNHSRKVKCRGKRHFTFV